MGVLPGRAGAAAAHTALLLPLASVTPLAWHSPSTPAAASSAFCLPPPPSSSVVRGRGAAVGWGRQQQQQQQQRVRCQPLLRMFDDGGGEGGGERRKGAGIRGGSSHRPGWEKAERELWEARRSISRGVLLPVAKLVKRKEKLTQERLARGEAAAAGQKKEDARNAVVATALLLAVVTAVGRLGGRAAVLGMLGLDMIQDADIAGKLDSVLAGVEGLGALKLPAFFLLWVVAKTLCVDALALVLALASGVIFGGVLEGALVSTVCATLASLVGFQLARTLFRTQVVSQLQQRPLLRALERAVAKDGAKAVFTFRLSPLVPALPIGGYNYLYGVTSIPAADFLAGIFAGSLKPYFLDSYLGVWGKDLLEGDKGLDPAQSALLFVTFFLLVYVGTLAAQIAGRAFDEAKREALMAIAVEKGGSSSGWDEGMEDGEWDWFTMLGIERPKGGLVVDEWRRLERAVQEEWRGALQTAAKGAEAPTPAPGPAKGEAMEQGDGVVPPYLEFDPTGQRPPRPLRKPPQALQTLVGLTLFPFVLLGAATGKLGNAVSSSSSSSSSSSTSSSIVGAAAGTGSPSSREEGRGEQGGEDEEGGPGGDNDSSSYPPGPSFML